MIVYARADWDASSLAMERKAWSDPRVVEAAARFVALRLDLSSAEGDAEAYAQAYDLRAVPTTVLFDPRGKRVASLTGLLDADRLLAALAEAAE